MNNLDPCMTCGACCAFFRVSFYWAEGDDAGGTVPAYLAEQVSTYHRCMSGTNQNNPRRIVLAGTPGESAFCTIYENRSSTCRELAMSGENGEVNEACNRARSHHDLPQL
ncbi:YkgJ family cysteine cluster protein [Salmonella enterica subsp. enterica serovar Reading]|nr:YkgJ family cysteine cluster protein [Salmonella enterica subsp. enterica serovar Reading]